jgi:hypothetical protein
MRFREEIQRAMAFVLIRKFGCNALLNWSSEKSVLLRRLCWMCRGYGKGY